MSQSVPGVTPQNSRLSSSPDVPLATEPFSAAAFSSLLHSLLTRHGSIDWMEWMPVALVTSATPERWVDAFCALRIEDQFEMLDLLRDPHSGPLAEALLLVLAVQAGSIQDEQVRADAVEEAALARGRQEQRLRAMRVQVEALSAAVGRVRQRQPDSLDLGAEALRLEGELLELRGRELNQDDRFGRVHSLEGAILRLETRRSLLQDYDFEERERLAAELEAEVDDVGRGRDELEAVISHATSERDVLRSEAAELEQRLAAIRQEHAEAEASRQRAQTEAEAATATLEASRKERQRLEQDARALHLQCEAMQKSAREAEADCHRERERMQALRAEAERAGYTDLAGKIEEVYRLLPDDRADDGFGRSPAATGASSGTSEGAASGARRSRRIS